MLRTVKRRLSSSTPGVHYHELLQMDETGEFSVVDQGYSAVMSNTQWVLGTK